MDELREMLLQLLHEQYIREVPAFIQNRFETEWEYVWIAEWGDRLHLYQAVIKAAEAAGQPVWNCGFGSGSFLFYLLDKGLNPLEPHWQCKDCGHVEIDEQAELCFDLPAKLCPNCKETMARDGIHGSPEEALRGNYFAFRVNEEFQDAAIEAVLGALKGHKVFQRRWKDNPEPDNCRSYYYTDELKMKDRQLIHNDESGVEYINVEDEKAFTSNLKTITIIAQTFYPMPKQFISMEEWIKSKPDISPFLRRNIKAMKEQGTYYPENAEEELLVMIDHLKPETWSDLIELYCYALGTFYLTERATSLEMVELIRGSDFRHILYSRESLQFYLRKQVIRVILDHQMVEQLRKGRNGWEMELFGKETPLLEKDKLFNAVMYLWPRTHAINWIWRYNSKIEGFLQPRRV